MKQGPIQNGTWLWYLFACVAVNSIVFPVAIVRGQIIPDNTLGTENSVVMPISPNRDRIDGGAIRGENLFHSFEEFSVGSGREAYFTNPNGISNIFSRVTGGDRSDILGTLGVNGDANLFLINPNGILFGPDATLDLRGAFHASTANEIIFPDGNTFSALTPDTAPLLTVDVTVPIGVEFSGATSGFLVGDITNEAELAVSLEQQLVLQGNTVINHGKLEASEGIIQLFGNRVRLTESTQVNTGTFEIEAAANVQASQRSQQSQPQFVVSEDLTISVTDQNGVINLQGVEIRTVGNTRMDSDRININGDILGIGNFEIDSHSLNIRNSNINILGDVKFTNDDLRIVQDSDFFILGSMNFDNNELLVRDSQLTFLDIGDSLEEGGILRDDLETLLENLGEEIGIDDLSFDTLDTIDTVIPAFGDRILTIKNTLNTNGRPRDIILSTRENQIFNNSRVLVGTLAGKGRNMRLMADDLAIQNSSKIFMFSNHDSQQGNLTINADQIRIIGIENLEDPESTIPNIVGILNFDDSIAGNLNIKTNDILMSNSSLVGTVALGRAPGGNLAVDADRIRISGLGGNPRLPSFLGAIAIGQENESNQSPSGGNIRIQANELLLDAGGGISTTTVSGPGGSILVEADQIDITGRSEAGASSGLSSDSYGQGDSGTISVRANSIEISNFGDISASSRRPQGSLLELLESGRDPNFTPETIEIVEGLFSVLDEQLLGEVSILESNSLIDSIDLLVGLPVSQLMVDKNTSEASVFDLASSLPNLDNILQERLDVEIDIEQPGNAGDIFLEANEILLSDKSQIFARSTAIGNGGNIQLLVENFLQVDDSAIKTTAGRDQVGGNGGDITIRVDNGFIVGVNRGGQTDIAANAFTGNGGNVRITVQDIFGFRFRDRNTALNDITASSTFGQDGEVLINTLNVDVARGLEPLPDQPVAPNIDDTCSEGSSDEAIAFFMLGQGGLPPTPDHLDEADISVAEFEFEHNWIPLVRASSDSWPRVQVSTDEKMQRQVNELNRITEAKERSPTAMLTPSCQFSLS